MGRRYRCGGLRSRGVAVAVLSLLVSGARPATATIKHGDVEISGNIETQNIIRHPSIDELEFIQNRNSVRIRIDYKWLKNGRFLDKFDLPFIKRSRFFLLYRGVYDGFYDLAPGNRQTGQARADDLIGGPIEGNAAGTCRDPLTGALKSGEACGPGSLLRTGQYSRFTAETRRKLKWENRIREVYVDLTLRDIPLNLRIGRQQVVWGEADQFRLADIWNPLDVSWRFPIGDTFDEFRVPLWLAKGIYSVGTIDLGDLGKLYNSFFEFVYNPFDFQPGQKVDWLPRPHSLPFANPLREGQIWTLPGNRPGDPPVIPGLVITPTFNLHGSGFHKGVFPRNPENATEMGARFHAVTSSGVEWTVNYIYGRGKWLANSPALGVKIKQIGPVDVSGGTRVGTFSGFPVTPAPVDAEVVHPYNNIFGVTGNYFDSSFTNSVLRMEWAYATGEPYATTSKKKRPPILGIRGILSPVGFTKKDVWAMMLGFDRPTWIRWLNKKGTWFLTGQLFYVHVRGNASKLRGFSSANKQPYFTSDTPSLPGYGNGGFGVWDSCAPVAAGRTTNCFTGLTERTQNALQPPADRYQKHEVMMTFAANTAYRGGSFSPTFITLFDPINLWIAPQIQLVYGYTNNLIFTLQTRLVIPMHPPTNDPWFVGRFGRRSETALTMKYQF